MTDNNGSSTRFNGERQNWKTSKKQMKGHKIIEGIPVPESVTE